MHGGDKKVIQNFRKLQGKRPVGESNTEMVLKKISSGSMAWIEVDLDSAQW
jgi:hypothetical protein